MRLKNEEEEDYAELLCDLGSLIADNRNGKEAKMEAEQLCVLKLHRASMHCHCSV